MSLLCASGWADYARRSYAGAGEVHVAHVTFAVGEAVWTLDLLGTVGQLLCFIFLRVASRRLHSVLDSSTSGVSKPRWPHSAVIPDLHLHCQRTLLSVVNYIYLSRAYLDVSDCVTHIWPILMALGRVHVCNDISRDIPEHDPPRMYVHVYLVRIDPRFRALH